MVRGRVTATLLESVHDLKLGYEARYRDFRTSPSGQAHPPGGRGSELELTPNTRARVETTSCAEHSSRRSSIRWRNRRLDRSLLSQLHRGGLAIDLLERFGAGISGNYNVVEFLDTSTEFFSHHTQGFGGTFLYDLSPLTSLLGEYVHTITPEPLDRPQAGSVADMFLVGLRGEITPMLRGEIHGGYATQRFDFATVAQDFSGFVADASLTRDFGERAALTGRAGRRTNPSAYDENGYYVSNYGRVQFITPFGRNFRMTLTGAFFLNDYPCPTRAASSATTTSSAGGRTRLLLPCSRS
jgi:hypothetical protein